MKKKKKKLKPIVIDTMALTLNRAGKVNKSEGVVYSGCGVHKDKKKYSRKAKHKKEESI